ncbi:elongation of very long chain fatty acids protein F-like [Drosophila nasuta]|uniref:elongation of very long chain fatty acids protein F-like n=1 Tax=Drosophila nasuta TaxID=42062 RepID=UPI00295ECCAE|nr:elongation of very long chain fatty acids protein F-like [Drosophila nasuta]
MSSSFLSRHGLLDIPDPALSRYPLLNSHWSTTIILVSYLIIVLKLGRKFMEHRNPYNLKKILIVYNSIQVIYNAILFGYAAYYILINSPYDRRCLVSLPYDHPEKQAERFLTYAYYINKLLDLCDTIFFILRKSYKQITTLHVYHHVMMPFFVYWTIRLHGFGGQYAVMGLLNTFVHMVMYFYYLISAMNPGIKSSLWWKKYITKLQMVQFILLLLQSLYILLFYPACKVPLVMQYLQLVVATTMILMFSNFYYHCYMKPKPQKVVKQE